MQKSYKQGLVLVLFLVTVLIWGQPVLAMEAETTTTTDLIPTQLVFDRNVAKNGDKINAALTINNQSGCDLYDVALNTSLPAGLSSDGAQKSYEKIAVGEAITHEFVITVGDLASAIPPASRGSSTNTGDGAQVAIALVFLVISLVAMIALSQHRKNRQRMYAIILCLLLSLQICGGLFPKDIQAEEMTSDENSETLEQEFHDFVYDISENLTVGDVAHQITTSITLGTVKFVDAETNVCEDLSTDTDVASGAEEFTLTVNSEKLPFKSEIVPEDIILGNAFESASIEHINVVDAHNLVIDMNGPLQEDQVTGILYFESNCFSTDTPELAKLTVDITTPTPDFTSDEDYLEFTDQGTIILFFSLGSAEFTDDADITAFSFDTPEIGALSFSVLPGSQNRQGALELAVDGITDPTAMMDILQGITMTIDEAALNCETLDFEIWLEAERVSVDMTIDQIDYDQVTQSQASANITGWVHADNAAIDLKQGEIALTYPPEDGFTTSALSVLPGTTDKFNFTVTIDDSELSDLISTAGEEGLHELFELWVQNEMLSIGEGCIVDEYGYPVAAADYHMLMGDLAIDENEIEPVANVAIVPVLKTGMSVLSTVYKLGTAVGLDKPIKEGVCSILGISVNNDGDLKTIGKGVKDLIAATSELQNTTNALNSDVKSLLTDAQAKNVKAFNEKKRDVNWTAKKVKATSIDQALSNMVETDIRMADEPFDIDNYKDDIEVINNIVNTSLGGGDQLAKKTEDYGVAILGDSIAPTAIEDALLLYDSLYNWESQSLEVKRAYVADGFSIYLKAYLISMCYMYSHNEAGIYDEAMSDMREQFYAVSAKCQAYDNTLSLPEGMNRNLIEAQREYDKDNMLHRYAEGSGIYSMSGFQNIDYIIEIRRLVPQFYKTGDCTVYTMMTSVAQKQKFGEYHGNYTKKYPSATIFEKMKDRLPSDMTLYDEMKVVGFNLTSSTLYLGNAHLSLHKRSWFWAFISLGRGFMGYCNFHVNLYDLRAGKEIKNQALANIYVGHSLGTWNMGDLYPLYKGSICV